MKDYDEISNYIAGKYSLDLNARKMPIEIPNTGRDILAGLFNELEYKRGVELGVERALYTEVLCKLNPLAKIYGIDPWTAYGDYRIHVSQEKLDGFFEYASRRVEPYGNCELIRKFSMDALGDFEDQSLDFVYIDANHEFVWVAEDIYWWSRKVRRGGIVAGHDYRKYKRVKDANHVVQVVNAYTSSFQIKPWFILGRRDAPPGEIRDSNRSWFWVKDYA